MLSSLDSICRDSADTQYMLIQISRNLLYQFHIIIPLMSLVKVTCSVWMSVQCLQISRIKPSDTLPLPSLSCKTSCRLAFVPVGNAYTTLCGSVFSTNGLVQILNVNHSHFKWKGLLLLTFWRHAGLHCNPYTMEARGCTAILWRCG